VVKAILEDEPSLDC